MKILSIIPIRAGSKRLKNKNLLKLNGKPLVNHILDKLVSIQEITKIIISTDYKNLNNFILNNSRKVVIEKRDKKLATDKSTALDVVKSIIKKHPNYDIYSYHLVTCPLIPRADLLKGIRMVKKKNIDFSVSVIKYEDPIEIAVRFQKKSKMVKPVFQNLKKNKTNSNFLNPSYRPTGGLYIGKKKAINKFRNFFSGKVYGVKFSNKKFIDIDTKENLDYANYLLKR